MRRRGCVEAAWLQDGLAAGQQRRDDGGVTTAARRRQRNDDGATTAAAQIEASGIFLFVFFFH